MRIAKLGKPRFGNPENWKHSENTKRKMSQAHKGMVSSMLGKFHSIESKKLISLNNKAKFQYSHDKDDASIELIDTIIWVDGTTAISKEDILAEQKRLQDIEDAK